MQDELKSYELSFFEQVHELDDTPVSFGFTLKAKRRPPTMADWVGAVGHRISGTGGAKIAVTIIQGDRGSYVEIVAADGKSLKPHGIRADATVAVGDVVNFAFDDRPYNPMKFKVTQNG